MICETCGKEHDGTFGSGRFCCRSCANKRTLTQNTKQKISQKLQKKNTKKDFNYVKVQDMPDIDMPIRQCIVCGQLFYHTRLRKTCCPQCNKIHHNTLNQLQKNKQKIKYKQGKQWTQEAYKTIYKWYFTYKITNLINGKYYYGIHMTNNLQDGYMGSGRRLKQAIKKYGRNNFKKEILQYYSCYKDLAQAEYNLITKEVLQDENCYNLTTGGVGGPHFKGHKHTQETKQKISEKLKANM